MTTGHRRAGALALALVGAALVAGAWPAGSAFAGTPVPAQVPTTAAVVSSLPLDSTAPAARTSSTITGTSVVTAIDDPASTRRVNEIIAALVVLAALLLVVSVWYWRSSKPVHPALDGLDLLGSNGYWRASPERREQQLDRLRSRRGELVERVAPPDGPERDATPVEPLKIPRVAAETAWPAADREPGAPNGDGAAHHEVGGPDGAEPAEPDAAEPDAADRVAAEHAEPAAAEHDEHDADVPAGAEHEPELLFSASAEDDPELTVTGVPPLGTDHHLDMADEPEPADEHAPAEPEAGRPVAGTA